MPKASRIGSTPGCPPRVSISTESFPRITGEFAAAQSKRDISFMSQKPMSDEALDKLQRATFGYFKRETNPANGMVPDNTRTRAHASIAAIGLGLAAYPVGVE